MMSKKEFKQHFMEQLDSIYDAYVKHEKNVELANKILGSGDNLPPFSPSNRQLSDEEKEKFQVDLNRAKVTENIAFTIGKAAIKIAILTL